MNRTAPKTGRLSGDLADRLSRIVSSRMGLYFPPRRRKDFIDGIAAAAGAFGFEDATGFAEWLLSTEWSRECIEELASCLTIGETYFFRNEGDVALLRETIIPELVRSRQRGERSLRFWSAGSCTGEEPYTIAMLLHQAIPDIEDWNVTILGTDINPRFLRKAAEGIYSEWSFRDTPGEFRDLYFHRDDQGRFRICRTIRDMVRFSYLNLASDTYPSLTNGTNAMDVILCRNVLIYFTQELSGRVLDSLGRSLVGGGWLMVGPSDGSLHFDPLYERIDSERALCFRKKLGPPTPARSRTTPSSVKRSAGRREPSLRETERRRAATAGAVSESLKPPPDPLAEARNQANLGRLSDAMAWCERAVAQNKMDPHVHHLKALILQELGRLDEAAATLHRVLYLDERHVLAHFALGSLRKREGKNDEASRQFANALGLLRDRTPEELIEHSEGITVGRMITIIEAMRG